MQKRPHKFKVEWMADGAKGTWLVCYRSLKYPRLSVLVCGKRGEDETVKQYRVDYYHPAEIFIESLEDAIRICRENLFYDYRYPNTGVVKAVTHSAPLEPSRARISERNLPPANHARRVGPGLRQRDRKDQPKEIEQSNRKLYRPRRVIKGIEEVGEQRRSVRKVRRIKKRPRL